MADKEALIIPNVDPELLEEQRLSLHVLYNNVMEAGDDTKKITAKDIRNVLGIINMLDLWSDEKFFSETKNKLK